MKCCRRFPTLVALAFSWIAQHQAGAQSVFVQQAKLVGTGDVGRIIGQGYSVSLSADGSVAAVGGYYDNSLAGAAWVFTRSGDVWSQQGNKLVGTGAVDPAYQGVSLSVSADGNTTIVGGQHDSSGIGAAWVFARSGAMWSQQGNKLVGTGAVGNAYQGYAVSLSADGSTAIVGGAWDGGGSGAAWVFARSGTVWSQQGSKLIGTGAAGGANQGVSVAVSADGNTAIVGGPQDSSAFGAAWVFTRSGGVWNQQGVKLVGTGAVGSAHQGCSVSLSADGNTALVGGLYDNPTGQYWRYKGAVWVFTRMGNVWSQQGGKLVGTGAVDGASQGCSVSLSADGNTAIVGGNADNNGTGAVWIFTRSSGVWSQQGEKLVCTNAGGSQIGLGSSVSLSADGTTAIVGGPGDYGGKGAAWVFVGTPAGIGEHAVGIPQRFELGQNYPNPFNPSTTIRYGLPHRSTVQLSVFNTLGQQIATLVQGEREAGYHEVQFDGSGLSSGVYFYRLTAGDYVATKKLLILK